MRISPLMTAAKLIWSSRVTLTQNAFTTRSNLLLNKLAWVEIDLVLLREWVVMKRFIL
jgi:hypothetical protein